MCFVVSTKLINNDVCYPLREVERNDGNTGRANAPLNSAQQPKNKERFSNVRPVQRRLLIQRNQQANTPWKGRGPRTHC